MTFQGNYIDLIIMVFLLVWIVDGWERGFFDVVSDLVAFLGAVLFGLRFYSRAAFVFFQFFSLSRGFANALGFLVVYSLAHAIILTIFVRVLRSLRFRVLPRFLRHFLGIFPAAVNGLIIVSALLTFGVSMPVRADVKSAILESEIGGFLVRRTSAFERSLDQVFGEALSETLAFLTVPPTGEERISLGFEATEPELAVSEKLEVAMFALVNHERTRRGIPSLSWDPAMVPVARSHAQDMFERGYFSHVSTEGEDVGDRLQAAGVRYFLAGENLAFAPSLELAHDGLMESEGHRENILATEFGRAGIGVVDGGQYGKMFVQVFAD